MGISSSTPIYPNRPTTALPQVGCGSYEVGCADLMIAGEGEGDSGVFMRIFYPSILKNDIINQNIKVEYPLWNERKEYIDGLADYRQMSHKKIHFYFDWIIGERRVPAGWHIPLFSKKSISTLNFHPSKSTGDIPEGSFHESFPLSKSTIEFNKQNILPKFPVIIFSHGLSGSRLIYSTFCSSLASYGFVVAAIEHRDRSSSWTYTLETDPISGKINEIPITMLMLGDDEREFKRRNQQNHKRVMECIRALHVLEELNLGKCGPADKKLKGSKVIVGQNFDWQQFKDRLDISKAAVIGHSMGGATAVAAAAVSTDFQASVVLDGWLYPIEHELYSKTTQPALLLNVSTWQWAENVKRILKLDKTSGEKILYTFSDMVHQSFSDFTYLMPGYMGRKFHVQGLIDPSLAGEAHLEMTVAFLRKVFSQESAIDVVRQISKRYSFVMEGTNIKIDDVDVEKDMLKAEEQLNEPDSDKSSDDSDLVKIELQKNGKI